MPIGEAEPAVMARVRATPRLRGRLPGLAAGRMLVIDNFASARCGVVVGDITTYFGPLPPPETHAEVAERDGIPVLADRRLVPLLEGASIELDLRRLPSLPGLAGGLEPPERWLEFLERPGVAHPRRTLLERR